MTQFIPTSELDFLNYRESLKTYLASQARFKDYDFEGSNFAVLLDVLALNTTLNAYYENMIGSEMFLDTAVLKDSVISRSKELNYTPRSRSSARTTATFTIDTGGDLPSSVTIPKYYSVSSAGFDANNDSKVFTLVTNTAVVVQADSFGNYSASEVDLFQGNVVREAFVANSTVRYALQANNVDVDTIEVKVTTSNTDNTTVTWSRTLDIYGLTSTSNVFFVQGYSDDRYEVVFGNGVIGRAVSNGNIINIAYVATDGEDGNGLTTFSPSVAVDGYRVSSIVSDAPASGGAEREDLASIKFHGPRHFTTQERAVIDGDFENLVREKFPIVQSVLAYGGELLNPPQFGRVALFIKPFGTEGIISDNVKRKIVNYLEGKSITTKAFVVDPEYFYVKVNSTVTYDSALISTPLEQLRVNVIDAIEDFAAANLTDFDSDLRYSKFVNAIDDVDPAIVSNDTTLSIIKRWSPTTGSPASFKFSFGTPLLDYDVSSELDKAIAPTITSSIFSYVVNGISYSAKIEDNGLGVLKVVANNAAKNVLNSSVGSVDYATGNMEILLNVSSYSGFISIYATGAERDVTVAENRFLILDVADVTVTMVAE
jgi:hypothetical protein